MKRRYGSRYWYWNEVPPQFKPYICQCDDFKPGFNYNTNLPVCRECGKLDVIKIRKCVTCENLFLQDFHAPGFCPVYPECWDCLDKDAPMCEHIPWGRRPLVEERGIVPPQLKKKVDISDFHDFDF